jgi:membrane protease YdiL (CAAX protease family)
MNTNAENEQLTNMQTSIYPSIGQSFGIAGIVFLMMLAFSPVVYFAEFFLDKELAFLLYYVITMLTSYLIVNSMKKKNPENQPFDFTTDKFDINLAIIVTVIALQFGIISPIVSLIPMPDFMLEVFMSMFGQTGIFSFISIVIAAPIFEELIFRGVMLDGLLKRYSPIKSILISSFLFGLIHLNPWQFIGAFAIGVLAGWVYYKTRKLTNAIIIHMANNGFAFLSVYFSDSTNFANESLTESYGSILSFVYITIGAIAISIAGILYLRKRLNPTKRVD